jgi:hypothetical protein
MEALPEWLEHGQALTVQVSGRDMEPGEGTLYLKQLEQRERRARALKGLGLCWLLAALSLPVMFFHFVLVPGFLLAGLVLFKMKMSEESLVLGGIIPCPACGQSNKVSRQAEQWPMGINCTSCGKGLDFTATARD